MNPQAFIRTEIPPMTVIFRHKAATIKIDSQIRYDAVYIKALKTADQNTAATYYKNEIHRASNSGKSYIVMTFNQIIGSYFYTLLSDTETNNYKNWVFLTFFHDDTDTLLLKTGKKQNAIDVKVDTLLSMQDYHFIKKLTVPYKAEITYRLIFPFMLECWGFKT